MSDAGSTTQLQEALQEDSGAHAGGWHLGARAYADRATAFRVWAPKARHVDVHLLSPEDRLVRLVPGRGGYHEGTIEDCPVGSLYRYRIDGDPKRAHADPASRHQPQGVHGPSEVVAPFAAWTDAAWHGIPQSEAVLYEMHVGTFTEEGTFDAVIPHLDVLADLGITVLEIMPVAQFSGARNWGYDGVLPFATQDTYGGPEGMARLVDACHARGMAVALDVVYNHLGPEGSVLHHFGPYFTERYRTPWGAALNFDGRDSDAVRQYFIENALYWVTDLHIDMLRLDAVHSIVDPTAKPFMYELTEAVHERARSLRRRVQVIAESAANDPRILRPREIGGFGMDAQWNDDFHHALHALLTGEQQGYFADFGLVSQLVKAYTSGYVFTGEYSSYRGRRHGLPPHGIPLDRYVVFCQNHDQTGNRIGGERLANLVGFEALKLAAGVVCLAPSLPMLFMGEEHAEDRPFLYFTSHQDPELGEAVRRGRREDGRRLGWTTDAPDPQSEETFLRSKVDHEKRTYGHGRTLWRFYRALLGMRRAFPALSAATGIVATVRSDPGGRALAVERCTLPTHPERSSCMVIYNLSDTATSGPFYFPPGHWDRAIDSADPEWDGPSRGAPTAIDVPRPGMSVEIPIEPHAFVVYLHESSRDRPAPPTTP